MIQYPQKLNITVWSTRCLITLQYWYMKTNFARIFLCGESHYNMFKKSTSLFINWNPLGNNLFYGCTYFLCTYFHGFLLRKMVTTANIVHVYNNYMLMVTTTNIVHVYNNYMLMVTTTNIVYNNYMLHNR